MGDGGTSSGGSYQSESVSCPVCEAKPGQPCNPKGFSGIARIPHKKRRQLATELREGGRSS